MNRDATAAELSLLKGELDNARVTIKTYEAEQASSADTFQQTLTQHLTEIQSLLRQLQDKEAACVDHQQQLAEAQDRLSVLTASVKKLEEDTWRLKEEKTLNDRGREAAISQCRADCDAQTNALTVHLNQLQKQLSERNSEEVKKIQQHYEDQLRLAENKVASSPAPFFRACSHPSMFFVGLFPFLSFSMAQTKLPFTRRWRRSSSVWMSNDNSMINLKLNCNRRSKISPQKAFLSDRMVSFFSCF